MANRNELAAYTSSLISLSEHTDLQERLKTYQVFLKLYEHHRGLLNEILDLENSSSSMVGTMPYVQGFISEHQSYLVTNLIEGKTQALVQPQQVWTIGRDPRRALIVIQDIRLSRYHAAIQYVANQGFYLVDLGSRNHSFVNGELVRQALLKDGDQVRLGSVSFTFFLCQSTQLLNPLSPEQFAQLNQWRPSNVRDSEVESVEIEAEAEEEDSIPTLDLYHDTSSFLRSACSDQSC